MAHTCEPIRAAQCRTPSVAAHSRSFRDVAGMSRYPPPKERVAPVFPPPLSQLCPECHCSGERRTDLRLERGGVALEVRQRCRGENCLPKTDRATQGVLQIHSHQSRHTVPLSSLLSVSLGQGISRMCTKAMGSQGKRR